MSWQELDGKPISLNEADRVTDQDNGVDPLDEALKITASVTLDEIVAVSQRLGNPKVIFWNRMIVG